MQNTDDKKQQYLSTIAYPEMTNEEYRRELQKVFDGIEKNWLLRYFLIFVSEKVKRVL